MIRRALRTGKNGSRPSNHSSSRPKRPSKSPISLNSMRQYQHRSRSASDAGGSERMMRYLLDTGIAQDFIARDVKVVERVDVTRRGGNRIGICTPVLGELWSGVEGSISRDRNLQRLRAALSRLVVWPYTNEAAEQFGRVFAELRRIGTSHAANRHNACGNCVRARQAARSCPRTQISPRFLD